MVRGQSSDLVRRGVEIQLGPVLHVRCKDASIVSVTRLTDRLRFFGRVIGTTTCDYDYGGLLHHVYVTVVEPATP